MSSFSPVDAVVSSSSSIGKYFAAVSVIPAALLVMYVAVLVSAGAWNGPFDPNRIGGAVSAFGWQDLAWFVAASLLVALAIHPLQFTLTQLLEGYWGASRLALLATSHAVLRHHRKVISLQERRDRAFRAWVREGFGIWTEGGGWVEGEVVSNAELTRRAEIARLALALPAGAELLPSYLAEQAYGKALLHYPPDLHRLMPTRFGNVLRRSEDLAGKQYGLDTLVIAPHLSLVAKPEHYAYVRDRQKAMDLAIALCLVAALASAITAVVLADDGLWCLLSLLPFALAYTAYRGAIAAAQSYCVAIETVTDLSRFELYDALAVERPKSGKDEVSKARGLMALLSGRPQPAMRFSVATSAAPEPTGVDAVTQLEDTAPPVDQGRPLDGGGATGIV